MARKPKPKKKPVPQPGSIRIEVREPKLVTR